jgi:hypothetical protein
MVLTDLGAIFGELWTRGVHRRNHVETFARALGFNVGYRFELSKTVEGGDDVAAAMGELAQVAAMALAEILRIEFAAPALVLSDAWRNVLTNAMANEPETTLLDLREGVSLDPERIVRRAVVAQHRDVPILVSPIVNGDTKAEFAKLFYFTEKANSSVKGIMPLVRAHRGLTPQMVDELAEKAARANRLFDFVEVRATEERYNRDLREYPAMKRIRAGSEKFVTMYRRLRAAA